MRPVCRLYRFGRGAFVNESLEVKRSGRGASFGACIPSFTAGLLGAVVAEIPNGPNGGSGQHGMLIAAEGFLYYDYYRNRWWL